MFTPTARSTFLCADTIFIYICMYKATISHHLGMALRMLYKYIVHSLRKKLISDVKKTVFKIPPFYIWREARLQAHEQEMNHTALSVCPSDIDPSSYSCAN